MTTKTASPACDIRLVLFDMDGTLLTTDKRITPYTVAVLDRLMEKGFLLAVATGRCVSGTEIYFKQSGFYPNAPCIGSSGAEIGTPGCSTEERIYSDIFSDGTFLSLFNFCEQNGLRLACEGLTRFYVNSFSAVGHYPYSVKEQADALGCFYPEIVRLTEQNVSDYAPYHVLKPMVGYKDEQQKAKLDGWLADHPELFSCNPGFPAEELTNGGVSKGKALKILAEHLGLTPEQVCVFGDSGNDVAMLKEAGIAVAMKNGADAAKNAAHLVTDYTNDEDGAAKMLEKLFLS